MHRHLFDSSSFALTAKNAADEFFLSYLTVTIIEQVKQCLSFMDIQVQGLEIGHYFGVLQDGFQPLFGDDATLSVIQNFEHCFQTLNQFCLESHLVHDQLFRIILRCI
eukprot:Skav232149  [mRNA]  locus=scaffold1040:166465:169407:+ [translate_table: standard]